MDIKGISWCVMLPSCRISFVVVVLFCFSFLSGSNRGCGAGSAILKVN